MLRLHQTSEMLNCKSGPRTGLKAELTEPWKLAPFIYLTLTTQECAGLFCKGSLYLGSDQAPWSLGEGRNGEGEARNNYERSS